MIGVANGVAIGFATTRAARALACAATLVATGCGEPPKPKPPRAALPPLQTSSLTRIAQGPGATWAIVGSPRAIFGGPLAAPVSRVLPKAGLDRLEAKLGFDVRAVPDGLLVGYRATTFWAVHLPAGTAPSSPLDAFEQRVLPPQGRSTPRPDLVRSWGSLAAGARASMAGMWSTLGDVVVTESGRLGPVTASMALATGKLSPARALAADETFAPLLAWVAGAELAVIARCPLSEALVAGEGGNVLMQECFGVGLSLRPAASGKARLAARVTGAWGKDAEAAAASAASILKQLRDSDLGRALGLRDAPEAEVRAAADAVDVAITVDAALFAEGLGRLLDAEIGSAAP